MSQDIDVEDLSNRPHDTFHVVMHVHGGVPRELPDDEVVGYAINSAYTLLRAQQKGEDTEDDDFVQLSFDLVDRTPCDHDLDNDDEPITLDNIIKLDRSRKKKP